MKVLVLSVLLLWCVSTIYPAPMKFLDELRQHNPRMTIAQIVLTNKIKAEINEIAARYLIGPGANIQVSTNRSRSPWELLEKSLPSFNPQSLRQETTTEFAHESFTLSQMLFEGDIVLTPYQADSILQNARRMIRKTKRYRPLKLGGRRKRKIYSDLAARWQPSSILYTYADSIRNNIFAIEKISEALNFWQDHTCLSFKFKDSIPKSEDHLEFFKGQGCYSLVGKIGGRQGISIGSGCLKAGVVAHEIAHSMGLWHEQSRPISRNYIKLNPFNIIPAFMSNFLTRDLSEITDLGIPYDLGSVMHYGPQAFTVHSSRNTIDPLQSGYRRTIGQRDAPAFYDVKTINLAYCKGRCASFYDAKCRYGGYAHPKDCQRCLCPTGLSGTDCSVVAPSNDNRCGGTFRAADSWQDITSPGYEREGYETGKVCNWLMKAPPGSKVELQFIGTFQLMCTKTCLDFVEVKNQTDFGLTGMRFCCYDTPRDTFVSDGSDMMVLFRSHVSADIGFKARFRIKRGGLGRRTTLRKPLTTKTTAAPRIIVGPELSKDLPEEPMFTQWGSWSGCSRSCGGCGLQTRWRDCRRTTCSGETVQFQRCGFTPCTSQRKSSCRSVSFVDVTCEGNICTKLNAGKDVCPIETCCSRYQPINGVCRVPHSPNGRWGQWSQWGSCFRDEDCSSCVLRKRYRVCEDHQCRGSDTDWEPCPPESCSSCGYPETDR